MHNLAASVSRKPGSLCSYRIAAFCFAAIFSAAGIISTGNVLTRTRNAFVENQSLVGGICDAELLGPSCCRKVYFAKLKQVPSFSVLAELNIDPTSYRFEEIKKAILNTVASNPDVHYIFALKNITVIKYIREHLKIAHDAWYCPEITYGTLFDIGNLYPGAKIASSADDWYPQLKFKCKFFNARNAPVAYVLSTHHTLELATMNGTCEGPQNYASWDAVMFEYLPPYYLRGMQFGRNYWGCENLAGWIMKEAGFDIYNLCPFYAPLHVHQTLRVDFRVRVNAMENTHGRVESVPDFGTMCPASK